MSNTAVLFQALPPQSVSSSRSHHHHHHSTSNHMKMTPPSPNHRRPSTTTRNQQHNHLRNDDHIRRGAQMVRQHISSSPLRNDAPRPYDDDDDEEITTEDNASVTSWSPYEYTVPTMTTTTSRIHHHVDVDPPSSPFSSMAEWSVDGDNVVDDDDDDVVDDDDDDEVVVVDPEPTTSDAAVPSSSPPPPMPNHHHSNKMWNNTTPDPEPGFIRSDNDEDDEDDSNLSDIVEIHDAWLDPFSSSPPPRPADQSSPQNHHQTAPLSHQTSKHSNAPPPPQRTSTSSSSGSHYSSHMNTNNNCDSDGSPYRHRTAGLSSSPPMMRKKAYPLPLHISKKSSPPKQQHSAYDTALDRYQDHDDDDDDDDDPAVHYHSPEHPVREVPIHTPSTAVSNLSSPGLLPPTKKSSLAMMMIQYDLLLRDPAYRHAQNAGFIWQSIVGQHIRFPRAWWNGARGPPIHSGYDDNDDHHHHPQQQPAADTNNIPWMYFGRHTISDHPVLNQLVKCRASAGRLLLHIVVLDLMTRTPIQDIVIGCFHPNSKGIRSPNSPPLKRYENCRDIWMAVRKRNHTAVAATDSLIYSPSHWENPNRGGTSAYQYSISRSPLGSGQRVTNGNVRAVFGDKAPLETIFLSEDELYERLANNILQQQPPPNIGSSSIHRSPITSKRDNVTTAQNDRSPPLAILQELVFA